MRATFASTLICLWVCLTWVGCSTIIPRSNYTWSENYALNVNGGQCSIPEMNDGDLKTSGRIGLQAIGKRTDTAGGAGVYDTELKIRSKVSVKFRRKQSIDKIVIHATNLDHFDVYWQDDEKSWQLLKSVRNNRKSPVVIEEHAVTDAILVKAKPQKPLKPMGRVLRDSKEPFKLQMEAQIAEIEVYGKKPIEITK